MPPRKKKKPTAAEERLNALLGLTAKVEEVTQTSTGNFYGVSEDELQKFREAQGLIYFLAAPALFHPKKCKNCGDPFIVSRMFVACCSYTCIRKDLEKRGFKWEKGRDLEAIVADPQVYDGNEPLWIREPQLSKALEVLTTLLKTASASDKPTQSNAPQPVKQAEPTLSETVISPTLSSPPSTTTPSTSSTPGTTLSKKRRPSRSVTFG